MNSQTNEVGRTKAADNSHTTFLTDDWYRSKACKNWLKFLKPDVAELHKIKRNKLIRQHNRQNYKVKTNVYIKDYTNVVAELQKKTAELNSLKYAYNQQATQLAESQLDYHVLSEKYDHLEKLFDCLIPHNPPQQLSHEDVTALTYVV